MAEQVTFRIQRFNPEKDARPYFQDFKLDLVPGMTILDGLHKIKGHQDGTLTFRRSCCSAICGSCAMRVNGANMLVCSTQVKDKLGANNTITIQPLPYLPIIKDLVVDRSDFWRQYAAIKPWLVPREPVPEKEYRITPEQVAALNRAETCIQCGACHSACTIVGLNKNYLGPAALLKAFRFVADPRDAITEERLKIVSEADGVFRCHTIFNCIDVCPKGLNPTKAIEELRQRVVARRGGWWRFLWRGK